MAGYSKNYLQDINKPLRWPLNPLSKFQSNSIMKQILFTILIFTCLNHLFGQTVTETTAMKVAASYFNARTGKTAASMTSKPGPSIRGGNPAYFICTPDNGKGFVIVAGTKASTPILAYSADSNFPAENVPPTVQYWMNGYKEQLEEIVAKDLRPTPQMTTQWSALEKGTYASPDNIVVGPLLQTTWDQWPYYNSFCPSSGGVQAPTGCVATAMAQLMKYWNYPNSGSNYLTDNDTDMSDGISGTFYASTGGDYCQWQNMPNALTSASSQIQINQVAWLMYSAGVAAKMDYGKKESGAHEENARQALINAFGYANTNSLVLRSNYSDNDWVIKIKNDLNYGMPVLYSGYDNSNSVGHFWVCDGYDSNGYFSMNWGWGGASNGFYGLNNLNPAAINNTLNYSQKAIVGIQPPNCPAFFQGPLPLLSPGTPFAISTGNYIYLTGGTAVAGTNLSLNAGNNVVLAAGVSILAGSTAHIFIEGCTGSFDAPVEDRAQPEASITETAPITLSIFPNPTTDNITLQFALPTDGEASLRLLDLTGQTVITMFENQQFPAGEQKIQCALDRLPAGVYFAKLETPGGSTIRKIMKVN
jgi:hypothetical protein